MKKGILCIFLVLSLLVSGCARQETEAAAPWEENFSLAERITDVTTEDDLHYSCDYMGAQRKFTLYLPETTDNAMLVIMLHGAGESADGFALDTKLHETLVPAGYAVAYAESAFDAEDRTNSSGWNNGLKSSGNDDAGFLSSLARYLQKEYSLQTERCAAAGFSNGACMVHRLAVDPEGVFTDVVSVAGMMPELTWNGRPENVTVSVLQVSGTKDDVVPQKRNGIDKYTKAPAIEDVMAYYAAASGSVEPVTEPLSDQSELVRYTSPETCQAVWEVSIRDGRHSWVKEEYCGFVLNALILEFLRR